MTADYVAVPSRSQGGPVVWFGGKGHLSGWIADHLPAHTTYVEPYGGAASVLFTKPPAPVEVYNDLHGDLANLFRVLRNPDLAEQLHAQTSLILHARSEYEDAVGVLNGTETDPLRRAIAFFVGMNQGFGGTYPTIGRWSRGKGQRMSNGMVENTAQWWRKVGWIGDWHERLATVQIENRDALGVIRDFDSPTTTFYLDPPYPQETRRISPNAYMHEMTDADHRRLVDLLLGIEGNAVLSGYATDLYWPLESAGWHRIERAAQARGTGGTGSKKRTEVLWVKGAHIDGPGGFDG